MKKTFNLQNLVVLLIIAFFLGGIVALNYRNVTTGLSKSHANEYIADAEQECMGRSNFAVCVAQANAEMVGQNDAMRRAAGCDTWWGYFMAACY